MGRISPVGAFGSLRHNYQIDYTQTKEENSTEKSYWNETSLQTKKLVDPMHMVKGIMDRKSSKTFFQYFWFLCDYTVLVCMSNMGNMENLGNVGNLENLTDKIYSWMLGSALGNAMGSQVENWTYERIEKAYGKIEEPLMLNRIESEDDYRIAMLYTEAYVKYQRPITPEDLAQIWLDRFDPATEFFWCMRNTQDLLRQGVNPRQTGIYNINTGSAIMAIAPVGIYHMGNPDQAFADALSLAYMYQPKADAYCAAAIAAGFAEAMTPTATAQSVAEIILAHTLDEDIEFWDKDRKLKNIRTSVQLGLKIATKYQEQHDWWGARKDIYDNLLQWHPIDPTEVLSITTTLFRICDAQYLDCIQAGTNIGRDADTISNLAGGLAACINGIKAIPGDWLEAIDEINPTIIPKFKALAHDFATVIQKKLHDQNSKIQEILRSYAL